VVWVQLFRGLGCSGPPMISFSLVTSKLKYHFILALATLEELVKLIAMGAK
jgi:hypothetical protein